MTASSAIAFGLVFLSTSLVVSLGLGIALRLASRRLRAMGAWAERRAATLALLVPPVLAALLVAVLAADSALGLLAGTDHCTDHAHHLHICLVHGAAWATRPLAVEILVVMGVFVSVRLGQLVWSHARAQRAAGRFRRLGETVGDDGRAFLVPLDEPMVFTAGALSPTVVISRGAWVRLGDDERDAVLAHELTHIAGGDIWRRAVLAALACFAAPGFATYALRLWDRAAERICDSKAAQVVGEPSVVAQAIVTLARDVGRPRAPAGAVFAAACDVTDRVHSLLQGEPDGARAASRLLWWTLVGVLGAAVASAVLSADLHHVFETILG